MIDWLKKNKLAAFLVLVVVYLLWKQNRIIPLKTYMDSGPAVGGYGETEIGSQSLSNLLPIPRSDYAPVQTPDRLVVQESSISLVVQNVREVGDKITKKAKEVAGFMVSSSLTKPEDAPYANIVVRVPAEKLDEVLNYCRDQSIKVSSENLYGYDVTDEYQDIEARLETSNKIKAKFEEILRSATAIQDIMQVNRELITIQDQIDNLKGRQKYLEQTAKLAKISIYLSTDELALPYAPTKAFRPAVIFKQAVRSLIGTLRQLAAALIWIVVFSPIWGLAFLVYRFFKKRLKI